MYQVILMYGDNEPWWFFENWQTDIVQTKIFDQLEEAQKTYIKIWQKLSDTYEFSNTKPNYLSAFWDEGDERWCEECDENLQQYYGLALLQNFQAILFEGKEQVIEASNDPLKAKRCNWKIRT